MSIIFRNFRRWWQPPRNLAERPEHRQVTFLELFYDLVYVVLIAELTHTVATHVDAEHLAHFAFLFFIVYWSWLNGTLYHELHGNNDIRTRFFTFLQMFTVAGMAVFVHDALGETSVGFALAFGSFQLILTYMWWRTGVHDPNHRPLSAPYSLGFLFNTLLFFGSVFVNPPVRFYIWYLATGISILLPLYNSIFGQSDPAIKEQIELSSTPTPSLVERFGLFTIIVLGEVIVAVVQGVASHHDLNWEVVLIAGIGMTIAIGLWWLYFDGVSHRIPPKGRNWLLSWMYSHIPVTAGIALTGAAVLNVVEHAGEKLPVEVRWLLVSAIAISFVGIAILIQILKSSPSHQKAHQTGQIAMLISAALILALGMSDLQTVPLMLVIVALMLTPIFFAVVSWLQGLDAEENEV